MCVPECVIVTASMCVCLCVSLCFSVRLCLCVSMCSVYSCMCPYECVLCCMYLCMCLCVHVCLFVYVLYSPVCVCAFCIGHMCVSVCLCAHPGRQETLLPNPIWGTTSGLPLPPEICVFQTRQGCKSGARKHTSPVFLLKQRQNVLPPTPKSAELCLVCQSSAARRQPPSREGWGVAGSLILASALRVLHSSHSLERGCWGPGARCLTSLNVLTAPTGRLPAGWGFSTAQFDLAQSCVLSLDCLQ